MAQGVPFIIPVAIDQTPQKGSKVPDRFRSVQWTLLRDGNATPVFVSHVQRLLGIGAPVRPGSKPSNPETRIPVHTGPRRSVLIFVVMGILVLAVAQGAWQSIPDKIARSISGSSINEKTIAVLPFVDMSEKHDQEYWGDGIAEEVINLLAKLPDLRVIGRTSTFSLRGKGGDYRTVASILGATYVVEGSVRRSGDHIRVTAQLVDTQDGSSRWSETYDRAADDAIAIQDNIATAVARALQIEVAARADSRGSTKSALAYDLLLRGMHSTDRVDEVGLESAIADFRRALDVDPSFTRAAEELVFALNLQVNWGFVTREIGNRRIRAAAAVAIALNPNSGIAHLYKEGVFDYGANSVEARRAIGEAVSLAPHDPTVLMAVMMDKLSVGDWVEATRYFSEARLVDPLNATTYLQGYFLYFNQRKFIDAEKACRRLLEISPSYAGAHYYLATTLLLQGRKAEALKAVEAETFKPGHEAGLSLVLFALGRRPDANNALSRTIELIGDTWPSAIAVIHAYRGETEEVFKWLDAAMKKGDPYVRSIIGNPFFSEIERDPRYPIYISKLRLPQ